MAYSTEMHREVANTDWLDTVYPIMEHFHTIQGEGVHTGKSAYFIRTGGCDVQCWWCDVKDSWDESKHPRISVRTLLNHIKAYKPAFVVITGGEPLLHSLDDLTTGIHTLGLPVHIETSGSSPISGQLDWVTLSPKRFKKPTDEIYMYTDELKVVVLTAKDLLWAQEHAARCRPGTRLLLQPEWDTPKSIPLIVEFVKENPQWEISLQTHKFLQVP